ncbi:DUF2273 domain-containing protein [Streptococcus sp. sy004]|uniref:DUF2273 domain-containing protein n=1 Tax=Streptococcus sp. sy004 TaxID=2600149 RepID=UPI0011B78DB6|nr:DUF2273 domain-containing protein [Streptococcus sp. sy004]TWT11028.1 DUF2273 domain-containing protein [Streptococcus sp. sy004]
MKDLEKMKLPIIGALSGLFLAFLLIKIGFFNTLFLLLLAGLGFYIGYRVDQLGIFKK